MVVLEFVLYKMEIDMDPRYVRLPKGSRDSLDHQCCLTAFVLGKYPSLHGSSKNNNLFSTNDSSWFTSKVGTGKIGRGRCPFLLVGPLNGQLLRGSCGTPHKEF